MIKRLAHYLFIKTFIKDLRWHERFPAEASEHRMLGILRKLQKDGVSR